MIIRDNKFDSIALNKEIVRLMGDISKTSDNDEGDKKTLSIKIKKSIQIFDTPSIEEVAEDLTTQLNHVLRAESLLDPSFRRTRESMVAPFITGAPIIKDDGGYITAFYTGNPDLNPPDIGAWVVVRVESDSTKNIKIEDGEQVWKT